MVGTEVVVAATQDRIVSVDSQGRKIVIRRPTALDTLRLFKAAGPTLAQNEPWLSIASLAYAVEAIDDIPMPTPVNEGQIEALIVKLGDAGLAAINRELDKAEPEASPAQVGN
jgi:hypothetical protein